MAFHELTTNAVKYGALSVPSGLVRVEWNLEEDAQGRILRIEWRELDGPAIKAQPAPGFGSRLLRQTITRELDGRLDVLFERSGLVCTITVSLASAGR
jgi:two-component sensor histidine kinase